MRILYFTRDYTPHDYRFLDALAGTEYEVFSLRLERQAVQREERPLPKAIKAVEWQGGREPFQWKNTLGLARDLKRVAAEVKPDVTHAGPVPNVAFLAALAGLKPLVSMAWGSDLLQEIDHSRWLRWTARWALKNSRVLLGDCQAVADKAMKLHFPGNRIVLAPWGVDLSLFKPGPVGALRSRLSWQDKLVLLSSRSWEPIYGIDTILEAFARAAQVLPEARLLLFGKGTLTGMVEKLIAEKGLAEKVYLGGQVKNDDLPPVYRCADLYLSASHSDGSSVSLMEALACGLPALVSDIPGNKEWITPGMQGWLFRDGDADDLEQKIIQAAADRKMLATMAQSARNKAEEQADWVKNFQKIQGAYAMAVK